jgi:hypothetical protein
MFAILLNCVNAFLVSKQLVAMMSTQSKASLMFYVSGMAILWHLILLCPSDVE